MIGVKSPPVIMKKPTSTAITAINITKPWKASVKMLPDMPLKII